MFVQLFYFVGKKADHRHATELKSFKMANFWLEETLEEIQKIASFFFLDQAKGKDFWNLSIPGKRNYGIMKNKTN